MIPTIDAICEAQRAWEAALQRGRGGPAARKALAVCFEAVCKLKDNLHGVGYPEPDFLEPCADGLEGRVHTIEKGTGFRIPPPLVAFWKQVGGFSLMTPGYEHVAFWREQGLGDRVSDPVHVDACTDEWVTFAVGEYEEWSSRDEADQEEWPFAYAIAPDGLHKDNISGGAPIAIVPGRFWRAPLTAFEWEGVPPKSAGEYPIDFISYLRAALLEGAGFPGLLGLEGFGKVRDRLLKDVPVF